VGTVLDCICGISNRGKAVAEHANVFYISGWPTCSALKKVRAILESELSETGVISRE
jgi:hypothetical protein